MSSNANPWGSIQRSTGADWRLDQTLLSLLLQLLELSVQLPELFLQLSNLILELGYGFVARSPAASFPRLVHLDLTHFPRV